LPEEWNAKNDFYTIRKKAKAVVERRKLLGEKREKSIERERGGGNSLAPPRRA